jgi:hypothetical protein
MEMEPSGTWEIHRGLRARVVFGHSWPGVGQVRGTSKGQPTLRWKSDPLVVLGARESRVQGEAAGKVNSLREGHMTSTQRETSMTTKLSKVAEKAIGLTADAP